MTDRFELRTFIGDSPVIVHCGEHTLRTLWPLWQNAEPEHTVCKDLQTGARVVSVIHDEIVEEFETAADIEAAADAVGIPVAIDPTITAGARAKPAPAHDGKPAWYGQYLDKGAWVTVQNRAGNPISYASPDAAIAGAVFSHPTLSKLPPYNMLAHDGGGS